MCETEKEQSEKTEKEIQLSQFETIMLGFKNFKLGNSYHRIQTFCDKNIDENYSKFKVAQTLANEIVNKHNSAFVVSKECEVNNLIIINLDLMVFKVEDFETIVEACIQNIPMEKILEIKKGANI